jgi:hypothetical protein
LGTTSSLGSKFAPRGEVKNGPQGQILGFLKIILPKKLAKIMTFWT